MDTPGEQGSIEVMVNGILRGPRLRFTFHHEGANGYCFLVNLEHDLAFEVGQRVRLQGRWSHSIAAMFEATRIVLLEQAPAALPAPRGQLQRA